MKYSLIAAAASVFFVIACGDDSSSNASSESPTTPTETYTKTGRYQIDESENLLILIPDSTHRYACATDGEDFSWKRVILSEPDTAKYEFQGDSLILHAFRGGIQSSIEEIFVGGKSGKFEGTWSRSCLIYHNREEQNQLECDNPPLFSFTFSDGKLMQTTIFDSDSSSDEAPDFMNSVFIGLYDAINEGFDIKKNEANAQVFEMNGKTFTFNVKKATKTPVHNGEYFITANQIQAELSDGTTTCELNYSEKLVDENLCNAENSKFLVIGNRVLDSEGNIRREASLYRNIDNDDFSECFHKLIHD